MAVAKNGATRDVVTQFLANEYGAHPDYPWIDAPLNAVFRHESNRKWFGVIMPVPRCKLGLQGDAPVDILNVKCEPLLLGAFRGRHGFFPAYHMNKEKWLSILLDGTVSRKDVFDLLDMSYALTDVKRKQHDHTSM